MYYPSKPSVSPSLDNPNPMSISPEIPQYQTSQDQTPNTVPLTSLPLSIEGKLGLSVTMPSGGLLDSSMATVPTFLSHDKGSTSSPSSSSPAAVDLSTFLIDIPGRYTSQDAAPPTSSPTQSDLDGFDSAPTDNGKSPTTLSLSDFGSTDDSVPLDKLKKGLDSTVLR
ncbi:hypothetical protein HAX54_025890 [Datura stramonium]|uniref:Uncharacterized protein n=1 Tax=Datura stramonium TaxID=4076 RepID=A0ABS8V1X1_DATST|nr:hypothetical protein [Datura stramonium]